jgi:hypothetical protein
VSLGSQGDFLKKFIKSECFEQMVSRGWVLPIKEVPVEDFSELFLNWSLESNAEEPVTFVGVVELIDPITYPYEWCHEMLMAAGELTLKIQMHLVNHGFSLRDASSFNVQFRASNPVFIDHGSFSDYRSTSSWPSLKQFVEHFINPLSVSKSSTADSSYLWRMNSMHGMSSNVARSLINGRTRFIPRLAIAQLSTTPTSKRIVESSQAQPAENTKRAQLNQLRFLKKTLISLNKKIQRSTWVDYHTRSHYSTEDLSKKTEVISSLGLSLPPNPTILDIGGNDGIFASLLSNDENAKLIVLDKDSEALRLEYRKNTLQTDQRKLFLCSDFSDLSEGRGAAGSEHAPFRNRVKPDVVLLLAVIHHLIIGEGIPAAKVAQMVRLFDCPAVLEVPSDNDPKVLELLSRKLTNDSGNGYSTSQILTEFRKLFREVKILDEGLMRPIWIFIP